LYKQLLYANFGIGVDRVGAVGAAGHPGWEKNWA